MTAQTDQEALGSLNPEAFRVTGLTSNGLKIPLLARGVLKRFAILKYKRLTSCLWVVFLGGTGTGKSTLFNAFCELPLSATGVERPKTAGPVAHAHSRCIEGEAFPFPEIGINLIPPENMSAPWAGKAGEFSVLTAHEASISHLVLVDTPDLDSIETSNHRMARDLYALSDVVVFVASQEKYADQVLHDFFRRVLRDERPHFFVLNKASKETTPEEILNALKEQGISIHGANLWLIPHTAPGTYDRVTQLKSFGRLKAAFFQALSREHVQAIKSATCTRALDGLKEDVTALGSLLDEETEAINEWKKQLRRLTEKTSEAYVRTQRERFSKTSGQYLRVEIRKLFSRYDLLAKPRRAIRSVFKIPFRLIGLDQKKRKPDRRAGLLKVRENVAFSPVQETLAKYNLAVLRDLSPESEDAPLYTSLRDPQLALTEPEIRQHIVRSQEELAQWLEATFDELAKGIPKGKKVGIYSTSILWGILILTFEVVVGGGFTMLDAALDSALAPFVTRGAVEIFAYHEIRKVAKELATRYQESLLSVLIRQEERYVACIAALTTAPETQKGVHALLDSVSTRKT